jgi:hypothetical protein
VLPRAARYYASGKVVTDLGENLFSMVGGTQDRSGLRSEFVTSSIVMIRGRHRIPSGHAHVGLTKHRLFQRDKQICAYCAQHYPESELTVEHILPVSRGGKQLWTNVVTACRLCPVKAIPVHDVSEYAPRGRRSRPAFRTSSAHELALRVGGRHVHRRQGRQCYSVHPAPTYQQARFDAA